MNTIFAVLFAGVTVHTAQLDGLYNDDRVVTNITYTSDLPSDYTTTNAVCNLITNNVASWAMSGKPSPLPVDYTTTNAVKDIASSASITNLGAVAVANTGLATKQDKIADYTTTNAVKGIVASATNSLATVAHSGQYSDLANKPDIVVTAFSTNATYAVGDLVKYDGGLWQCTSAVTTPGPFNECNWGVKIKDGEIEVFYGYYDGGAGQFYKEMGTKISSGEIALYAGGYHVMKIYQPNPGSQNGIIQQMRIEPNETDPVFYDWNVVIGLQNALASLSWLDDTARESKTLSNYRIGDAYTKTEVNTALSAKQDKLPYATNAIPAGAISGAPWIRSTFTPPSGTDKSASWDGVSAGVYGLKINGGLWATEGLFVDSWDKFRNNNISSDEASKLPYYLAHGTWNTATDRFVKQSDITSLRAVTYAANAPESHKTAAGILSSAENTAGTIATNTVEAYITPNNPLMTNAIITVAGQVDTNTTLFVTNSALTIAHNDSITWQESFGGYKMEAKSAATVTPADHGTTFVTLLAGTNTVAITAPASSANGEARDFILIVSATDNTQMSFANFTGLFAADMSVTNALNAGKTTLLYFTEMRANEWFIGRQEAVNVTP